jgi:hypothetical protein
MDECILILSCINDGVGGFAFRGVLRAEKASMALYR